MRHSFLIYANDWRKWGFERLRVDADILVYTPEEWAELQTWNPFIQQVIREGEIIYEAESA